MNFLRLARDMAAIGLFVALFLTLLVGVVSRYAFHAPIAWADELAVILFIWVIFFTSAFSLGYRDHFGFDVVYDRLAPRARRVVSILTCHGIFPPRSIGVRPNLRPDNEANAIHGRAAYRHPG